MTRLKDAQIAGKILFLGVSVTVFLEEMSIKSVDRIRKIYLSSAGGHDTVLDRMKRQRKSTFALWV